jgi:protein ImuA
LPMNASRRLQLAAEKTGAMGIVLRRWRRQNEASDYGQPTASTTRWRISTLPSERLPVAGVGRARWLAELHRGSFKGEDGSGFPTGGQPYAKAHEPG